MNGEELYNRLSKSLVECSLRSQKFFLPDVIDDEITTKNVKVAALSRFQRIFQKGFDDKIVQQTKKVFAILVMIEKPDAIKALLAEELNDSHLPLAAGSDNILVSANGKAFLSFQLWKSKSRDEFLEKQWWVQAPVLKTSGQHIKLDPKCAMPITDCKSVHFQPDCTVHQGVLHTSRHQALITTGTNTKVAIKEFLRGPAPFDDEIYILDRILNIHHPHLIQHICSFVADNRHYVVFPWAGGGNLREYWEKQDHADRTADLFVWHLQQLLGEADALRVLHKINCRHGDLKPENILYFDEKNNFVIADVGVSSIHKNPTIRRSDPTTSKATTPSYEAPDVVTGINSPRSRLYDIWSLGCIFLEFLVWFLFDHNSIDVFSGSRLRFNTLKQSALWKVIVHPVVSEVIAALRSDPRCEGDTALGAVLDLISETLLRIEVKERHAADQVVDKLRTIYERAKSESSYCFNAVEVRPIKPIQLQSPKKPVVHQAKPRNSMVTEESLIQLNDGV
ncbi:kinase-like protein [Melanomma pulvis-pyrius CBS 109.77]|uniref:Kinase-like protein n=1 Tax=Melanomma pulvis-pyrius CBS 109.77 TaxID=1314802 RepID=A0A6A6WV10_9PLEO|nr:kinase-like protein [Melanomma pulvis-pyrius CBS 109.77]